MKKNTLIIILAFTVLLTGCSFQNKSEVDDKAKLVTTVENKSLIAIDYPSKKECKIAADFLNNYNNQYGSSVGPDSLIKWVKKSNLVTNDFKNVYENMHVEAWKSEPEMGLDYDPVLNAQDNPSEFKIDSISGAVVYFSGTDWKDFNAVVELTNENGVWLVHRAGSVNKK